MVYHRNATFPLFFFVIFATGVNVTHAFDECDSDEVGLLQSHSVLEVAHVGSRLSSELKSEEVTAVNAINAASNAELGITAAVFVLFLVAIQFGLPVLRKAPLESYSPYVAEFLGTFVLVFTVGCCKLGGNATFSALAIACVLMVMIYSTASASGGNLNPAVSLALYANGDTTLQKMLGYWFAQVTAGLAAGLCFAPLFSPSAASMEPGTGFKLWHAGIVETIYTFMLCFVVLNCATVRATQPNNYFGLAIGFVIIAGGYAAGGISGAAFNPAVAIGVDVSGGALFNGLLWSLFELVGALAAAVLFKAIRPGEDVTEHSFQAKCLSEFVGTFMLVLTVGLNVVTLSPATALSAGMALMCMIYSLGDVSGAHFNPAVTLAVSLRRSSSEEPGHLTAYAATQIIAGLLAGALYGVFHLTGPNKNQTFGLAPGNDYSVIEAGLVELFATAVLAYVVLSVATVSEKNHYFGLAIGSCVIAGGFAIGGLSGGELNPAVSIGVTTGHMVHSGWDSVPSGRNCVVFALFELMGGMVAAGLFHLTHPKELSPSPRPCVT